MKVFLCGDYEFLCRMFGLSRVRIVYASSVLRLCNSSTRSTLLPMGPDNPGTVETPPQHPSQHVQPSP